VPTKKIIKTIRRIARKSLLIQFKLEIQRKSLIEKAFKSLKENRSDFVVANALEDLRLGYKAFLIDRDRYVITLSSKKALFHNLYRKIKQFTTKKY
jgi:phosphopantothenoylcysteine synthetase/decarboxylase